MSASYQSTRRLQKRIPLQISRSILKPNHIATSGFGRPATTTLGHSILFDLHPLPVYLPRMNRQRLFSLTIYFLFTAAAWGETFRIAAYNVENYLDQPT